jgi:hypothetical protein
MGYIYSGNATVQKPVIAQSCSGDGLDLYLEGAQFECQTGRWLSWQIFVVVFLSPFRQMPVLQIGHDRFLSTTFQYIINKTCYHSTVYSTRYWWHSKIKKYQWAYHEFPWSIITLAVSRTMHSIHSLLWIPGLWHNVVVRQVDTVVSEEHTASIFTSALNTEAILFLRKADIHVLDNNTIP